MQHIGIEKINENFETLQKVDVNFADIILLTENDQPDLSLISQIDPYGLTVLNSLQIPLLLQDLKNVKEKNPEITEYITKLVSFLEGFEPHEYAKFIGD